MDLVLRKTPSGALAPADEPTANELAKLKVGQIVHGKYTKMRSYENHKRMWALWSMLFDIWSETTPAGLTYKGEPVVPTLDNFRKDLTILAGHWNSYVNLRGEVRLEAKSISFSSMDELEFQQLFSRMIDVALTKVLSNTTLTEESLRQSVEEVLRFDS